MNFSGKYQVQTQENYEAFMKAVGECWAEAGIMAMKAWPCEWWPVRVLKSDRGAVQASYRFGIMFCRFLCSFELFLPGQDYTLGKWKWH